MSYRTNKNDYLELKRLEHNDYIGIGGQTKPLPSPQTNPQMKPQSRSLPKLLPTPQSKQPLSMSQLNRNPVSAPTPTAKTEEELFQEDEERARQQYLKMDAELKADLAKEELAKLEELKRKYGSTTYYHPINEMKQSIKKVLAELTCCGKELNIEYDSDILPEKMLFLDTLKKHYAKMVAEIITKNPSAATIDNVIDYVSVDDIQSHIEKNYEPIIRNIFNAYESFIKAFTADIKKQKIPFYSIFPINRKKNSSLIGNTPTPTKCNMDLSGQDCYLVLASKGLITIILPIDELYKIINKDPNAYPGALQKYIAELLERLKRQLELFNYIVIDQELHNYKSTAKCMYNKGKYGDRIIYDNRVCPPNKVKSSKECVLPCPDPKKECIQPCSYDKKNSKCKLAEK